MEHEEQNLFKERLVQYLQGTTDEEALRQLLEMVRGSEENRRELAQLKAIYDSLSVQVEAHNYPVAAGWEKMLERIKAEERPKGEAAEPSMESRISFSRHLYPIVAYVAVFLLALLCGTQYFYYHRHGQEGRSEKAYTLLTVEKGGGKSSLFLPDGTKVLLNAGTTLQYPVQFDSKERRVCLEGEGYFEVAKNPQKPFVVKLKGHDVKVLGTVFNVKAYPDVPYSTISLVSGKVLLTTFDTAGETLVEQVLHPDETARVNKETGEIIRERIDSEFQLAWLKGLYKFKDKSFKEIASELERLYDVTIEIENEQLACSLYTGSFVMANTIEEVLQPLGEYNQFQYQKQGRVIRIFPTGPQITK